MLNSSIKPRNEPSIVVFTAAPRSEEHTSELQSRLHLVCRLLLEKKKSREHRHDHPLWSRHRPPGAPEDDLGLDRRPGPSGGEARGADRGHSPLTARSLRLASCTR